MTAYLNDGSERYGVTPAFLRAKAVLRALPMESKDDGFKRKCFC
jgi:hypothetical protein